MKSFFFSPIYLALALALVACCKENSLESAPDTITVSGFAKQSFEPDLFLFRLEAELLDEKKENALARLEKTKSEINRVLKECVLENPNNKTDKNLDSILTPSSVSIQKLWTYADGSRKENGFSIRQSFSIKISDLKMASDLVSLFANIQDVEVAFIEPKLSHPEIAEKEVLQKAYGAALEKATTLSSIAGGKVGKTLTLSETEISGVRPRFEMKANMLRTADAVSESGGISAFNKKFDMSATIHAVFELKDQNLGKRNKKDLGK